MKSRHNKNESVSGGSRTLSGATRRQFLKMGGLGVASALIGDRVSATTAQTMNILFLTVDDLRLQLGCYGVPWMKTPNIDRLAAGGTLFERAYSQFPVCGPSRASLHSGYRPTAERFQNWNARIDKDCPGVLTLAEHFKNNGYQTQSLGKVIHDRDDCEQGWSEGAWIPDGVLGASPNSYLIPENRAISVSKQMGPPYESADVEDSAYGDGQIADRACEELKKLASADNPFFLAVGFLRPHLPFSVPQRYWDLYARDKLPLAENPTAPLNAPKESLSDWGELRKYRGMPREGPLDEATARTLIHGYCAGVSYMDAQLGRVLDTLEKLGQAENTLVILVADHGWQLGDHGMWAKHTLYEQTLHCPLIVRGPGIPSGRRAAGLVEYVDVYPSLCEASGLQVPSHVQGRSFLSQLKNSDAPGKTAVFSRHGPGDSVKTDRYRYSEFRDPSGKVEARMLYDHKADPGENRNIAEEPDSSQIVAELSKILADQIAHS